MPSRDTDDAPLSVDLMTNLLDTQPKMHSTKHLHVPKLISDPHEGQLTKTATLLETAAETNP